MIHRRLKLPEVIVLRPDVHRDHRGCFSEMYRSKEIGAIVGDPRLEFVQGNYSTSVPLCIRGLHYQLHSPQGKLVQCIVGEIYDVALDVRADSETFGQWCGVMLGAGDAIWIPPGFAHGFMSQQHGATITYACSTLYREEWARAVRWNDPNLGINWPIGGHSPVLTEKDRGAPLFADAEKIVPPLIGGPRRKKAAA